MNSCKYNNADELPMILSVKQVSDFLGMGITQTYELVKRIDFPAFRVGNRVFVPRDKLIDWVENQTAEKETLFYTDPRGNV